MRAVGDDGAPGGGAAEVPGSAPALGRSGTRLAGRLGKWEMRNGRCEMGGSFHFPFSILNFG